jgi:hypothetical protein
VVDQGEDGLRLHRPHVPEYARLPPLLWLASLSALGVAIMFLSNMVVLRNAEVFTPRPIIKFVLRLLRVRMLSGTAL